MEKTQRKSLSDPPSAADPHERDASVAQDGKTLSLPSHVAGSGALDLPVETARDNARQAAADNTLKAYARDWSHFARWCRMRGAEPLPPSPQIISLYIADLAAPSGKAPALSVASIERRLSGLVWGYAQRGDHLDRKDRHMTSVLAGIRRKHARPPAQKEAILHEDLRDMLATLPPCRTTCAACATERSCSSASPVACAGQRSWPLTTARMTRPTVAAGSKSWRTAR